MPRLSASPFAVLRKRSVLKGPGSRPLMVTLLITVLRDRPAMKPVRPARAPLDNPNISIGAFTAAEVMLTMRPNLRAIMPSTVALISSIGVSMLASIALIQSARVQLRKSPGGGPPALLTRMSGSGQAFSTASRPAGVVMSPTISVTVTPGFIWRISSAVFFSTSAPRAVSVTCTPSLASAMAQARPNPLLDAQTMARRPLIPRSTVSLPSIRMFWGLFTLREKCGAVTDRLWPKCISEAGRDLNVPACLHPVDIGHDVGGERHQAFLSHQRQQRPQLRRCEV